MLSQNFTLTLKLFFIVRYIDIMPRNKKTASLKAGITFLSFLSQLASIQEDKGKKKEIDNTNRLLKALRYLLGIER